LATALVAGACGDDGSSGASPPTAADAAAATVQVAKTGLGDVLVDHDGFTLYLFTKDTDGSSACTGACATTWPPLRAVEATVGDGLDEAKLATLSRIDGAAQVTYAGKPLYRYGPDQKPGDVNGQGVGGVWFAVRPDGSAASASSGASYQTPSY
jgi:predicted lipoprotein with Yx(FWY)xxD motif